MSLRCSCCLLSPCSCGENRYMEIPTMGEQIADLKQQLAAAQARIKELEAQTEALREDAINKVMSATDDQINAALRMEGHDPSDAAKLAKQTCQLALAQARIAELREALEHYAEQDIRNARHYPPEFAKDALASTDDLSALESIKAAAKREALMEALAQWEAPWNGVPYIDWLRRMVGEVK